MADTAGTVEGDNWYQKFMDIKMKSEMGVEFEDDVKDAEIRLSQLKIRELEKKIATLEMGEVSESEKNLIKSYMEGIKQHQKRMMDYEKRFYERFEKPSDEGKIQRP